MIARDELVCPPSVPARGHSARRLALRLRRAQLSRRRRRAWAGCFLRNVATLGLEVRASVRPRTSPRSPLMPPMGASARRLRPRSIGVGGVIDAEGNELVAQNADEPFVPASVVKIVTGLDRTPAFQHRAGTAKVRPEGALIDAPAERWIAIMRSRHSGRPECANTGHSATAILPPRRHSRRRKPSEKLPGSRQRPLMVGSCHSALACEKGAAPTPSENLARVLASVRPMDASEPCPPLGGVFSA